MAPITATSTGLARQTIDDPELLQLINSLSFFDRRQPDSSNKDCSSKIDIDVDGLVIVLEKYPTWRFEEQADLYEWIHALDIIDAALAQLISRYPALLLIGRRQEGEEAGTIEEVAYQAESLENVLSVSDDVVRKVCSVVRFLCCLLRNATSKPVFNSVDHLVDLLAAADDQLVNLALEALSNLATPPMMHRQQEPQQLSQQNTALHTAKAGAHARMLALARGWGSRGSGLGLFTCATADDSSSGQGSLPHRAGELFFQYFDASSHLITIYLQSDGILQQSSATTQLEPKSTAEIFFLCLKQAGDRTSIPRDKAFTLLANIRLSRSFYSNSARIAAVQRRLMALKCALLSNPSSEVIAGYFHAQPELCSEIVDLVRPTISPSSVSFTPLSTSYPETRTGAISAVGESYTIPYSLRTLAIETLTTLVTKKEGSGGGLTPVARQINILAELGVGKGQYLGFLPTLIQYTLASLNNFLNKNQSQSKNDTRHPTTSDMSLDEDDIALDLGMTFLKATKSTPPPQNILEERALEFIDSVLTLTSAVVSVPSGTAALTDCGLIQALISTVALDTHVAEDESIVEKGSYSSSLLKFIIAQAIQILEGAIVTQGSALSAFHDLHGVELLVSRLFQEIKRIQREGDKDKLVKENDAGPVSMDTDDQSLQDRPRSEAKLLRAARRVLLFSILNCLTIVFHQHDTVTASTPSSGSHLRTPELTCSLIQILDNVSMYGGVLAALTATLLSDVMNSDPQVVHHVHSSGLAKSFLNMLMHREKPIDDDDLDTWNILFIPPSPELIMHIPNVIQALALTENGVKVVQEIDPFPAMLSLFYNSQYAMPNSRCLLNEMTAIVGTGLDEMMRHVPVLRPLGISALITTIRRILKFGNRLLEKEKSNIDDPSLINERTYLIQYSHNISQLLEQVLHNEEHSTPFVESGGLESLLQLQPLLMPYHTQFLSHMSCLSSPVSANLTHSMSASSIASTIKSIASHYDSHKMIRQVLDSIEAHLVNLNKSRIDLLNVTGQNDNGFLDCDKLLDTLPRLPIHLLKWDSKNSAMALALSEFLRNVVTLEWLINVLVSSIRSAYQRSHEMGSSWSGGDREMWKKEISSDSFADLVSKLSSFYRSTMLEVCRMRTEESFEEREFERRKRSGEGDGDWHPATYTLRIVCQEGAVVRDGIEIDSCAPVGGLEMGEIVEAFDRCVNSSGVMRYYTRKGWVSEQTRGHGREPIAEVLSVSGVARRKDKDSDNRKGDKNKRIECGIYDLCAGSASVLSRMHSCHKSLFTCLTRAVAQGVRSISVRSLSVSQGLIGSHVGAVLHVLSDNLHKIVKLSKSAQEPEWKPTDSGVAMYLGNVLELLHSCLYEEKRERRVLNIPLLVSLMALDVFDDGSNICSRYSIEQDTLSNGGVSDLPTDGVFAAIRFVLKYCLQDMNSFVSQQCSNDKANISEHTKSRHCNQRLSRAAASSLPSALALLRRLGSRSLIVESQMSSILNRLKSADLLSLFGESVSKLSENNDADVSFFAPDRFARCLHCTIATIVSETWSDSRFSYAPAFVVYPIVTLINEVLASLEDSTKASSTDESITGESSRTTGAARITNVSEAHRDLSEVHERLSRSISAMSALFGSSSRSMFPGLEERNTAGSRVAPVFEPSEATIERLLEMGFSRDHALDALESTESNRLEVAMEYALAHPPPSPSTIERRRVARAERRRHREARLQLEAAARVPLPDDDSLGDAPNSSNAADSSTTANSANEDEETTNPAAVLSANTDSMVLDLPSSNESRTSTLDSGVDSSVDIAVSETRKKEDKKKRSEIRSASYAKTCLALLRSQLVSISLRLIVGGSFGSMRHPDDGTGVRDDDAEALVSVISSFLLDLCERYPVDRSKAIYSLLTHLKTFLKINENGSCCGVLSGYENEFASICHASVILLRALPRSRVIALRLGLVNLLLGCMHSFLESSVKASATSLPWPRWTTPVILLLDVMAQPTAAPVYLKDEEEKLFTDGDKDKKPSGYDRKGEFVRVILERKKQSEHLSKTALDIVNAINGKCNQSNTRKKPKDKMTSKEVEKVASVTAESKNSSTNETIPTTSLPPVPLYMPLLPHEEAELCLPVCLDILRRNPKKDDSNEGIPLPSGLVHATFLLLARILRSHKIAMQCLRLGGTELILSLPFKSRFPGLSGIVTVIFRHMLEDEPTLRTAMESEIRCTVTKLHKQQSRSSSSSSSDGAKISAKSFVQAMTPLICRDPVVFLKAAATSVSFKKSEEESSNRRSSTSTTHIVLLTASERATNIKALADIFSNGPNVSSNLISGSGQKGLYHGNKLSTKSNSMSSMSKSMSPGATPSLKRNRSTSAITSRCSPKTKLNNQLSVSKRITPKKIRKEKSEKSSSTSQQRSVNFIVLNGSPGNHVISLFLTELILTAHVDKKKDIYNDQSSGSKLIEPHSFFTSVDLLEILADLVLSVPACAAAIHRYRPSSSVIKSMHGSDTYAQKLQHAFSGCSSPSNTAVSYLLHTLLPQVRNIPKSSDDSSGEDPWMDKKIAQTDESAVSKEEKKFAYLKIKIAQATARLLVALCARAGESRRRVIADLIVALSVKSDKELCVLPNNDQSQTFKDLATSDFKKQGVELWALQSWAELCFGLAAPRTNGITQDCNNSALSFDVVKLMLEHGVAHALMRGIQRVNLYHPMASNVCGALLRPMEIVTRGSVVDAVEELVKTEGTQKKEDSLKIKENDNSQTLGSRTAPPNRVDGTFADDSMIEEGFVPESAERSRRSRRGNPRQVAEVLLGDYDYEGDDFETEDIEEIHAVNDVEMQDNESDNDDDIAMDVQIEHVDEDDVESDDESLESDTDESSEGSNEVESIDDMDEVEEDDVDDEDDDDDDDDDEGEDDDHLDEEGEFGWGEDDERFFPNNASGAEEGEEALTLPSEAELEEGWTRIDSSGFGGVLLGTRHNNGGLNESNGGRNVSRARGFVIDAAEAMIGNILRGTDIQLETLAEIEDTLGIRIMHSHRPPTGADPDQRAGTSFLGVALGSGNAASSSTPEANTSRSRGGAIGYVPSVNQSNFLDNGLLIGNGSSGRTNDFSYMEYAYGGFVDTQPSNVDDEEDDLYFLTIPANIDPQLFPEGTAVSTHSRTQQSLHPMLCGVELPPVCSLRSRIRPQGVRSTNYRNTESRATEINFSALAGGNIIRLNRGPNGTPLIEHHWSSRNPNSNTGVSNDESRWTDDGQPLDPTTRDFSSAFEQILGETITRDTVVVNNEPMDTSGTEIAPAQQPNRDNNWYDGAVEQLRMAIATEIQNSSSSENESSTQLEPEADTDSNQMNVDNPDRSTTNSNSTSDPNSDHNVEHLAPNEQNNDNNPSSEASTSASNTTMLEQQSSNDLNITESSAVANASTESNLSEGEGVANSLATGLRLSPESESSTRERFEGSSSAEQDNGQDQSHIETLANQEDCVGVSVSSESEHRSPNDAADISTVVASNVTEVETTGTSATDEPRATPNEHGLVCPPGMDTEVFDSLPVDMQREIVEQHRATIMVSEELGSMSRLDPEALVALPEDMRREIIEQEQQERRLQQQQQADPSNAEEMDNASFVASLAPDLREEILLTADDSFLSSLPPDIIAEAQILRERASTSLRRTREGDSGPGEIPVTSNTRTVDATNSSRSNERVRAMNASSAGTGATSSNSSGRRRNRTGKFRVDCDRPNILYIPSNISKELGPLIKQDSMQFLIKLYFLLSPVRPQRLLAKIIQNLCANSELRRSFIIVLVSILNDDSKSALSGINLLSKDPVTLNQNLSSVTTNATDCELLIGATSANASNFPPCSLIGIAPEVVESDLFSANLRMFRTRPEHTIAGAAAIAANLPASARGSLDEFLPSVAARRIIECLGYLSKNSPRFCIDTLLAVNEFGEKYAHIFEKCGSCLDRLLDLLSRPLYSKSAINLEQTLSLLENVVGPLSVLPREREEIDPSKNNDSVSEGKEWVTVPRVVVSQRRLKLLCSVLRLESCRDSCFQKVNTIARRLCRVQANRSCILRELASVAQGLGVDAIRDLKLLSIRLNDAAKKQEHDQLDKASSRSHLRVGIPGSDVTLSTSSSEVKLLRVLHTLHILCTDSTTDDSKKTDNQSVSHELVDILKSIDLESLWDELTTCLRVVSVLEGVADEVDLEEKKSADNGADVASDSGIEQSEMDTTDENAVTSGKKLKNSVSAQLSRYLPTIEAFFLVNASTFGNVGIVTNEVNTVENSLVALSSQNVKMSSDAKKGKLDQESNLSSLVGGQRLIKFVAANRVLLNALLRANHGLLEKSLKAMVQVPQCRPFLDFDVKRLWFKTQVRRLRQHASRRHGSLRLNIRRKHVFEDAYHQLRLRTADEMRGRLHITFRNEEGVDAGGLSREFFGILAKEMFNPNYALFTSTEDGCTFQPNPNSSINPDHLSYFRFVGRIVGKAVLDGFLLDAHFTRSLYKHMLGIKPTYQDMQAIDPDYYKNLKMILEYNLDDIGLDHLTFSTEDHSFGRIQTIDLIPNGRNVFVSEATKEKYVNNVCQYRMTTSIQKQIKDYLDGFYELVKPELISIFTARELELLISGLPEIDMLDLQRNTEYQGFKVSDKEIGWFWNIMSSLSRSEKAAFIQFVTGSSKVPLEGFSQLQGMRGTQKFSIHKAGGSSGALISAHTCFNALDLPLYKSEEEMKEKFLYAINEGLGGFLFA